MTATFIAALKPQRRAMLAACRAGKCFVYLYLRSVDGAPYYVGIASNPYRPFSRQHTCGVPVNPALVRVAKVCETLAEAADVEQRLIAKYGRLDQGTGILRNRTDGGQGAKGRKIKAATLEALTVARTEPDAVERKRLGLLRNGAAKYGIDFPVWESLTKHQRKAVGARFRAGKRGQDELLANLVTGVKKTSLLAAQSCGIEIAVWLSLKPSHRATATKRMARGWPQERLLEGFVA